jgi:RNA 3'-terminal phosphate cyclase (ATP)
MVTRRRQSGSAAARIGAGLDWSGPQLRTCSLPAEQGPGNALLVTLEHEHVTEVFTAFGGKSVKAETIAKSVLEETRRYIGSCAAWGSTTERKALPAAEALCYSSPPSKFG